MSCSGGGGAGTGLEVSIIAKKDEVRDLAVGMARLLDEKLAEDALVLDMRQLMYLTDYFILATGRNPRHTQSLAEDLMKFIRERGGRPSVEGLTEGRWVLFDCGDVVVHLFDEPTRRFYDLEHLWADAPRRRWKPPVSKPKAPPPNPKADGRRS